MLNLYRSACSWYSTSYCCSRCCESTKIYQNIHNLLPFYFALIFVMIWLKRSILCKTSALKNCKIKTKWNFTFVSKSNRCCSVSKLILTRHFLDKIYTNYWDICKISSSRSIITMSSPYLFLSCFQLFSCTRLCNRPSTKNDLIK